MTAYIIAGAPSPDLGFISANIPADGFVLCTDKGYSYALRAGVMPDVIIGDFDSCTDPIPEADFVTPIPFTVLTKRYSWGMMISCCSLRRAAGSTTPSATSALSRLRVTGESMQ